MGVDGRTTLNRYQQRSLFATLLVAALLAVSGLAAAAPDTTGDSDTDSTEESAAVIEYEFFEDQNLLVYWMTQQEPSDEDPVDCTEGLADATVGEDDAAPELPDGCYGVDVLGPNDQLTHGTVMSAFVHSLKDAEFDGPRGHAVRELARSDLGKDDKELEADDDLDTDSDEPKVKEDKTNGPSEHANANAHTKKPKP